MRTLTLVLVIIFAPFYGAAESLSAIDFEYKKNNGNGYHKFMIEVEEYNAELVDVKCKLLSEPSFEFGYQRDLKKRNTWTKTKFTGRFYISDLPPFYEGGVMMIAKIKTSEGKIIETEGSFYVKKKVRC